jgi:threonine/homoserine/homoserine lactone efflux protein
MHYFLKGIIIGISIAAPVGPIGILCIRQSLAKGRAYGLISGLGAATADAVYGSIAGFGLTFIASALLQKRATLHLAGGLFLCYLGIIIFRSRIESGVPESHLKGTGRLTAYLSAFLLTLANPMTILSFAALFAGLGLADTRGDYRSASFLVLGVFTGSALWWVTLSTVTHRFRSLINPGKLLSINRVAACILIGFGLSSLWGLFR